LEGNIKGAGQPYEGGQRQWQKIKHRDTVDVVCAAVIGPSARPQAIVVGMNIKGNCASSGAPHP
jgi:ATP-dependent DNA ligase